MLKLEYYIHNLLFKHDCVVIPNFGAFILHYEEIKLNKKKNIFSPPTKKVSFNSTLKKNDGLLIKTIASNENLSFQDAYKFVNTQVAFWKEFINEGNKLTLKNIGILIINKSKKIEFIPLDNENNYYIQTFGLEKIKINKIDKKNILHYFYLLIPIILIYSLEKNKLNITNMIHQQWSGILNTIPINFNKNYNTFTSKNNNTSKYYKLTILKEKKITNNEKEIKGIIKEIPIFNRNEKFIYIQSNIDNNTIKFTKDSIIKNYTIVIASLKSQYDAINSLNKIKKQGFNKSFIIPKNHRNKYFYVNLDSFKTEPDARKYLNNIIQKFPDAWIRKII